MRLLNLAWLLYELCFNYYFLVLLHKLSSVLLHGDRGLYFFYKLVNGKVTTCAHVLYIERTVDSGLWTRHFHCA